MKGTSFKDLRDLQKAQKSGLIQMVTPDQQVASSIAAAVAELANLWTSRNDYAKALIAAGVPDAEVLPRAEALAVEDHKGRTEQVLALFKLHGGKVPEGLKYVAHLVGLDADKLSKPEEVVNLHG